MVWRFSGWDTVVLTKLIAPESISSTIATDATVSDIRVWCSVIFPLCHPMYCVTAWCEQLNNRKVLDKPTQKLWGGRGGGGLTFEKLSFAEIPTKLIITRRANISIALLRWEDLKKKPAAITQRKVIGTPLIRKRELKRKIGEDPWEES